MSSSISPRILPPSLGEKEFDEALDEISLIVGPENVSRDSTQGNLEGPQGQKCYGDIWALAEADAHEPSGAIRPCSVPEIQEVLKVANRHRLPLWTVSRGRNLGYGGSAGVMKGCVILDLHRMNKIVDVNEEYAYAVVEPGVSFFDLYNYIQDRGYDLWPSCPALGWGSVLGNTLERGFGYTPGGEHSLQQCGMEVVLPSGDVLRTGMGAMEKSPMGPLFKGGFGPGVDGLFYQSNIGIVTKIGMHLTPAPEHYIDCEVSVQKESEVGDLCKIIAWLERAGVIQNHASISNIYRQAMQSRDPNILQRALGPGTQSHCASDHDLADIQREQKWGYWKALFAIYGVSLEAVNASWAAVRNRFSVIPGVIFHCQFYSGKDGAPLKTKDMPEAEIPHNGFPRNTPLPMVNARGMGGGHICFSPLFPPGGKELQSWYETARRFVQEANFDFFADFHVLGRYIIAIIVVVYGPTEGPKASSLYKQLMDDAHTKHHATEYRTHIDYMDEVAGHFDFGDGALRRFVTGLKNHVDPNGVLSQGKSGIWNAGNSKLHV